MRTVLHVMGSAELGSTGVAAVAIAAARALPDANYRVCAAFMGGDGPLVGRLIDAGVPASAVYWGGARNLVGDVRAWLHFRRLAPDIVHQHFGGEYLRCIARAAGVRRIIVHFHDHASEVFYDHSSAIRPANGSSHSTRFADAAIAISRSVAKVIRGRITPDVIYPCVVPLRTGTPPELAGRAPVIGALSRLTTVKGYIHLIRAMPEVIAAIPAVRLEIAGEGEDAAALQAEIGRLALQRAVMLLGWQDDLGALFARWRVFAAPSLQEGFGVSILEAAMRGLPIVASRVGGIPELLEHGVSGLLVPPADQHALAASLVELLLDTPRAASLAAAAAARAREIFAPATFASGIRSVYARL